jgi:methionyl-tRNA formyltransferase
MNDKNIKFAFFGGSEVSIHVLNFLKENNLMPSLIITTPDKPKGRKQVLTSPLAKDWAVENNVRVLQPAKLKDGELLKELQKEEWDVFVVASYGKIIPDEILEVPKYKSINMHPSLLPELRGPSPIVTMILEDKKETGVTIMLMDAEMDHGPILAQEKVVIDEWPCLSELEKQLARIGGRMLVDILPKLISGNVRPWPQEHEKATFSRMIKKEEAEINLEDDDYLNYRKIIAYERLKPFFFKNGKRIVVNDASFENGNLQILRVTPEGKKEMDYKTFLNS